MAAARGVKRSPSTAFIVTTSPMPTACPPSVRAPAAGSGSELMTMESRRGLTVLHTKIRLCEGDGAGNRAVFGESGYGRSRLLHCEREARMREATRRAGRPPVPPRGSARRRRTRCFKGMTSLFGRDCSHSLCQRKENMQPGRTEDLRGAPVVSNPAAVPAASWAGCAS